MRLSRLALPAALLAAFAAPCLTQNTGKAQTAGEMPPGHGVQCLKADGKTPCGNSEVSDLNQDIKNLKATFSDAKSTTGDVQQNVTDAQQEGSDAKQMGSDAKHPVSNAGHDVADAKQAAGDAKSAYGDAQQTNSDAQQTGQDVKQNVQDAEQTIKDLKGIGLLALKKVDGTMNCAQNDGSPCSDSQTKALQSHASQKTPPITVKREADQAGP